MYNYYYYDTLIFMLEQYSILIIKNQFKFTTTENTIGINFSVEKFLLIV